MSILACVRCFKNQNTKICIERLISLGVSKILGKKFKKASKKKKKNSKINKNIFKFL